MLCTGAVLTRVTPFVAMQSFLLRFQLPDQAPDALQCLLVVDPKTQQPVAGYLVVNKLAVLTHVVVPHSRGVANLRSPILTTAEPKISSRTIRVPASSGAVGDTTKNPATGRVIAKSKSQVMKRPHSSVGKSDCLCRYAHERPRKNTDRRDFEVLGSLETTPPCHDADPFRWRRRERRDGRSHHRQMPRAAR